MWSYPLNKFQRHIELPLGPTNTRIMNRNLHLQSLPDSSIVMFVNELYYNRKLANNLDRKGFSVEGTQRIFIYENLTQARKKLFWMVKQKAKLADYKDFLTMNLTIYTRKHNDSNALIIKGEKDLDLIK